MWSLKDQANSTQQLQAGTHQNNNTTKFKKLMTTIQYETSYFHKPDM